RTVSTFFPYTTHFRSGSVAITTENGNSIIMNADGSIDVNVADKFSVTNNTGELIDWFSQTLQAISEITTNTTYGVTPINNKADRSEEHTSELQSRENL